MTCRCTPQRPCLNCERASELKAINAAKDREEALARGKRRYAANANLPVTLKNKLGSYS